MANEMSRHSFEIQSQNRWSHVEALKLEEEEVVVVVAVAVAVSVAVVVAGVQVGFAAAWLLPTMPAAVLPAPAPAPAPVQVRALVHFLQSPVYELGAVPSQKVIVSCPVPP